MDRPMLRRVLRALLCAAALCAVGAPLQAVDLKMASVAPDGSHWMQEMRKGAEQIQKRTNGRVTIKFYPGGVMGNDSQVLRKIRIGQLQGGALTAGALGERYVPLSLYGIPLLFRSLDEVDAVRSKLDAKMRAGLEQAGFVTFGFTEGGFANLLSNEPIHGIDEMKRKKVWVPEGDAISFLAMEKMGLSPVTLPVTDVLTGLQTGLVEITFASPVVALVLQWHTKTKFITELPVSYSLGIFAIEKAAFGGLSAEDQQVVREVMSQTMGELDKDSRTDNRRALDVLHQSGLKSVNVSAADVASWRRSIEALYPEIRQRPDVDPAMFDELVGILKEYRSMHPDSAAQ